MPSTKSFVTALLTVGVQTAYAQADQLELMPSLCLSKLPAMGEVGEADTLFDHSAYLAENIQSDAYLYEYRVCRTADKGLASIEVTYMDEDRDVEQTLKRAGPEENDGCVTEKFEQNGAISKLRIFYDGSVVTGMAFGYIEGLIV